MIVESMCIPWPVESLYSHCQHCKASPASQFFARIPQGPFSLWESLKSYQCRNCFAMRSSASGALDPQLRAKQGELVLAKHVYPGIEVIVSCRTLWPSVASSDTRISVTVEGERGSPRGTRKPLQTARRRYLAATHHDNFDCWNRNTAWELRDRWPKARCRGTWASCAREWTAIWRELSRNSASHLDEFLPVRYQTIRPGAARSSLRWHAR